MNREHLNKLGLLGLVMLAALAIFYGFTRYQQKKADRTPLDDRNLR